MTRTNRTKRLSDVATKAERQARQRLAAASNELKDAEESLEEIFVGCRRVAESSDELSIRFGRALIESGWLAAQEQQARCATASAEVAMRSEEWSERRSRVDALGRLLDRLRAAEAAEEARLEVEALEDVIASRAQTEAQLSSTGGTA